MRPRALPSIGSVLLLMAALAALLLAGWEDDRDGSEPPARDDLPGRAGVVVGITDGDTIRVRFGRREESVRYIGVDTPESVIPGEPAECLGRRASRFNAELVVGRQVNLEFDRERRDRYGRLLAYVYAGGRLVNAQLVRAGLARRLEIAPNTRFAARFARLERAAATAGRGLWASC